MKLSDVQQMAVAVWGGGRDGRASVEYCLANQCQVVLVSDDPSTDIPSQDTARDLAVELVSSSELESLDIQFLIRSPGISRYRPEIEQLTKRGIQSSNLLALWLADQPPERVIGVTGTKGKSTTATIIEQLLRTTGQKVCLAGNIGVPVTHVSGDVKTVVLEVSSYQASDCTTSPAIGVLTALGQDHITWHGSLERYHHDKVNLFAHSQLEKMIFHLDDNVVTRTLDPIRATSHRFTSPLAIQDLLERSRTAGVYERMGNTTFPRNLMLAIHAAYAAEPSLTGEHVLDALENLVPLPSRQNTIGMVNGVTFIDDALASNPMATIAAIERFSSSQLVVIIGGQDRTVDYGDLITALNTHQHVVQVVLMGDHNDILANRIEPLIDRCQRVYSHDVGQAVQIGLTMAPSGGVILFSPAAPTPSLLGDYTDRSDSFQQAMHKASSLS